MFEFTESDDDDNVSQLANKVVNDLLADDEENGESIVNICNNETNTDYNTENGHNEGEGDVGLEDEVSKIVDDIVTGQFY